jgi:hypothetical protein
MSSRYTSTSSTRTSTSSIAPSARPTSVTTGFYDVPTYSNIAPSPSSSSSSTSPSNYTTSAGVKENVPWKAGLALIAGYMVVLLF